MASKRKVSPFVNRKASVSLHRNGLSIEIADVPAVDTGVVAKELLDMMRQLIAAGYDELVSEGPSTYGGGFDLPEEEDMETFVLPPEAKRRRPMGFLP